MHAIRKGLKPKTTEKQKNAARQNCKKYGKEVLQLDLQGNPIRKWESAAEVKRQLGIDSGDICKCCKGKKKTVGGFKWVRIKN